MKKGKFIVVEGVGGAGKSSVIRKISKRLKSDRLKVTVTREPGGLPEAESIRDLLFELKHKKLIEADAQVALFSASRKIWVEKVVLPALKRGDIVLADRSYISTNAYQGAAEGGDKEKILQISKVVMNGCMPDLVILLDIDPKEALERNSRSKNGDPFDDEDISYAQKVVNSYRQMAKENYSGVKWTTVDASQSLGQVTEKVYREISKIL